MATRNRFSTSSQPLRIHRGGTSVTSDQEARNKISLESAQLSLELLKQRHAKETSPFARMVEDSTLKLKDFQNKAALKKAADGDLTGFIDHAKQRIKEKDTSHEWERLLQQAVHKLEDQEWKKDIDANKATLNEFATFLERRLKETKEGSSEALDTLKTIADVQRSIKAVAENAKDQKAYLDYTKSNDHEKYKDYLESKLMRTTDGKMQADIVKAIGSVDDRMKKEAAVKRAQELSAIESDYRTDKIGAAEAIARAEKLRESPGIGDAEVQHVTSAVNRIMNHREAEIKAAQARASSAAGASGGFEDLASFKKDLVEFEKARAEVQEKINSGIPLTPEDINRLNRISSVIQSGYETAAQTPGVSASTAKSYVESALTASKTPHTMFTAADKAMLKGIDLSPAGKDAFNKELAAITDPVKKAEMLAERAQTLKTATASLITPQYQKEALLGSGAALADARKVISQAMNTPAPMTEAEKSLLAAAYTEYANNTDAPKAFSTFITAVTSSKDPNAVAAQLGVDAAFAPLFAKLFQKTILPLTDRTVTEKEGRITGSEGARELYERMSAITQSIIANEYGARVLPFIQPSDMVGFMRGQSTFGTARDPRRDESYRASIGQGLAGWGPQGTTAEPPAPPRQVLGPTADVVKGAPGMDPRQGINLGADQFPTYGDPGFAAPAAPPQGYEQPVPTESESGFLHDQREDLFGNRNEEQQAYDYLDATTPITLEDWSLPTIPDADPVWEDPYQEDPYDISIQDQEYAAPDLPTLSDLPDDSWGGGSQGGGTDDMIQE